MEIKLRIFRFDPEKDERPRYENYVVDGEPNDQVLDLLNKVKWYQDGTLAYRRSCAHGICGSDALRINDVNRLACKVLVKDVGTKIKVEPILGLPVVKDLIVDMEPFFEHYRSVMPYLVNDDPPPEKERPQTVEQRSIFDDTTKCILCAACTTSCPSYWASSEYIGPAAVVQAHRFIFDSRDKAGEERLALLNDRMGVWRCHDIFNCTDACPGCLATGRRSPRASVGL
jgi:succinate dehydrogenase / fumarate reductase iron-sulfur subunit